MYNIVIKYTIMFNFTDFDNNKKFWFVPKNNWIDKVQLLKNTFNNDVYQKYDANLSLDGELIVCSDIKKQDIFCKKIVKETYDEYLDFIKKRDVEKERWVYNILDGIAEQEAILYKDEHIVVIPNYSWNGKDKEKMHILTFPTDRLLRSIRDLTGNHIELLQHCKEKTLEAIKKNFGFDENIIKMYFHYSPSTYHLHIHFVLISNTECNSSVEYSHELSSVIFNLSVKSDYYQIAIMNKRI